MQMTDRNDLESIFQQALEFDVTSQREAYLDEVCGDDVALRSEMDRVLRSHDLAGSFLAGESPNLRATEFVAGGLRNESVLGMFKDVIGDVPSIALRESPEQEEHIQRPSSSEIPATPADGRYQLQGEIARGGMGVVIKGRDTDLGRDLAVKILLESHKDKPEVTQRFIEEAQIGGQLQHPGIAPVYELGQFEDQRPYFTMKLVKGKTLAALLASRKSLEEDRAKFIGIFEQVCQTMAYAHSRGVIHRDLKPANIMVGAFGEVQVMDWGLAKVLSSGGVPDERLARQTHQDRSVIETLRSSGGETPVEFGSQTQMGSVMGTPAYMAPEQALGEIDQLDQRADVFGLGAVLCEVLTGKPPYVAEDALQIYRLATRGKLDECFQRLDESKADSELVELAKSCLSPEPSNRPHDAEALAHAVSSYQHAVETRLRDSEIDRAAQTARAEEEVKRRRVGTALAAAIVALVVAVGGGAVWLQAQKTVAAETIAEKNQEVAAKAVEAEAAAKLLAEQEKENARQQKLANEKLRWQIYKSDVRRAQAEIQKGQFSTGRDILLTHLPKANEKDLRGFEWHYLYRLCPESTESQLFQWEDAIERDRPVSEVVGSFTRDFFHEISRDGSRIATITNEQEVGETQIVVWNTKSGKRVWNVSLDDEMPIYRDAGLAIGKDEKALRALRISDDGRFVGCLTQSTSQTDDSIKFAIQIWDIDNDKQLKGYTGETPNVYKGNVPEGSDDSLYHRVRDFAFRPGTSTIAVTSTTESQGIESQLLLLDFQEGHVLSETSLGSTHIPTSISVSAEGRFAAITLRPAGVRIWEPDRNTTLPAEAGCVLRLVDLTTGTEEWLSPGMHLRNLGKCAFSPDGKRVGAVATNRVMFTDPTNTVHDTLVVWDVASGAVVAAAPTKLGFSEVKFSNSGRFVLLVPKTPIENPEVFRVADATPVIRFENPQGGIVTFSADEAYVQAIDHSGMRRRWKLPETKFREIDYSLGVTALSGDTTRLISKRWEGQGQEQLYVYRANGDLVQNSKFPLTNVWSRKALNHNGSIMAVHRNPRDELHTELFLWDIAKEAKIRTLFESTTEKISSWAWRMSPTGTKVAAVVEDRNNKSQELRIWDHENDSVKHVKFEKEEKANYFVFSRDGQELAVFLQLREDETGHDTPQTGTVLLVNPNTGRVNKRFALPGRVVYAEFRRDLQRIVVRKTEQTIEEDYDNPHAEVWNLGSGKCELTVPGRHSMIFSPDGDRLISMTPLDGSLLPRITFEFSIFDSKTGDELLSEEYTDNGVRPWLGFRFLAGTHRVVGLGLRGGPQFWDGTPVELPSK